MVKLLVYSWIPHLPSIRSIIQKPLTKDDCNTTISDVFFNEN